MELKELASAFAAKMGIEGLAVEDGACALEIDGIPLQIAETAAGGALLATAVVGPPPPNKSEGLLYGVIDMLNRSDEKFNTSENWDDFSAGAKQELVGKTAKIVVPVMNEETGLYDLKPLVVDGEEVVRPLTAEDVDTIGKASLFNSVNIF